MKVLCIHPALAPYRLDFFNLLAEHVDLEVAFVHKNVVNQKFDQAKLTAQAKFRYCYLKGFDIRGRNIRFGIGSLIRSRTPDIVISYEASPITMWLCMLKLLRVGKWKLWTSMDEAPETITTRKGIRARVRNWVLRHCDGVVVPSDAAAEAYRSVLIPHPSSPIPHPPSPKFAIVPIIHDTATIRKNAEAVIKAGKEWRSTSVPSAWEKVLLFVGRLTKVKNLHWLIEQMAKLDEHIGLVLIGGGDEEDSLKYAVEELKLSQRVMFVGRKMGEELYAIMSATDALVLPSTFEPYGAVVPEAMQWGAPCVISDRCGSVALVKDGVNGIIFPCGSSEKFLQAIRILPPRCANSILRCDLRSSVDMLVQQLCGCEDMRQNIS